MKFAILFFFALFASLLLGSIIPYWGIMIILAGVSALVKGNGVMAFFSTALGVGSVWLFMPLFIWSTTGSELPQKMGEIMGLGNSSLLLGISGLIGFLIGGFSGLTGNLFGRLFESNDHY